MQLISEPHRRLNPLTGEWVLVSPHRTARPWQGQVETTPAPVLLQYDPTCYLCPGNERAGGVRNPKYTGTFVFENDFAALRLDAKNKIISENELLTAEAERGICRVMCFSPRHDLTLSTMNNEDVVRVVDTWVEQYVELGTMDFIRHVQIFENRGAMMGASNPHPHCQIWANETLPNEPAKELRQQGKYLEKNGHCLLCRYLEVEINAKERLIFENDSFAVVVPFWAVWPFETIVLSKRHFSGMDDLSSQEREQLAMVLRETTAKYDNLFGVSFPYSMGFHQRPTDGEQHPEWHFHAHFYPPLLRSATIRKFMVGYELLGSPQRDLTPEAAAERLRAAIAK
ncbi:MAG: UDP-glucose--hexose-phosphate uridylyltransferase [Acidobacteriales bacterium]|nr:UDP-glucose--hexose-phosphate uridylyltransferase [Terriglobales bacterium]